MQGRNPASAKGQRLQTSRQEGGDDRLIQALPGERTFESASHSCDGPPDDCVSGAAGRSGRLP